MNDKIEAMRRDRDFRQRLVAGDLHARTEWAAVWSEAAGQPEPLLTPQEAIDQLRASDDFRERLISGDVDARQIWNDLYAKLRDGA
ncbi:hypothetical protein [Geminicoccus flavidas]|uniref:hypothetical protein n=1 Tax=Geminicoccus flavidas TaxID=2506407 RepID=UPI00135B6865|nr:hypothetical protein [Geminicoccus flavidas]